MAYRRVCQIVWCQLERIIQFVNSRLLQSPLVQAFEAKLLAEKLIDTHAGIISFFHVSCSGLLLQGPL